MAGKDPRIYLQHIRDCCLELLKCAELRGSPDIPDSVLFSAVCRNIEIIGQAANRLGREFHANHPQIPWRQIIASRNLLIHNYDGVEMGIVFGILDQDIPQLLASVNALLDHPARP